MSNLAAANNWRQVQDNASKAHRASHDAEEKKNLYMTALNAAMKVHQHLSSHYADVGNLEMARKHDNMYNNYRDKHDFHKYIYGNSDEGLD
jgi:hypothetical protein